MRIDGIARYPIKGFSGDALGKATLTRGQGVPGDRRFAFGIDATKDDGTWYSSRNYLINSRKDNLLKFSHRWDRGVWDITSPEGQVLRFDEADTDSIARLKTQLGSFFDCVETDGQTPCLIDRSPVNGPKGHWDFTDTELLIVNLATLRALEQHWGIEIDPRRFRANLLIDGLPAWAEFGLYGAEFSVGAAKITMLRPARRCPAMSVHPTTGDRGRALQNDLVKDFGHGFFGVYAKVSGSGDVVIGDSMQRTGTNALGADEMTCDLAPDISLWPKAASITATDQPDVVECSPTGPLTLAEPGAAGRMKIHLMPNVTLNAEIVQTPKSGVILRLNQDAAGITFPTGANDVVLMSGPFAAR